MADSAILLVDEILPDPDNMAECIGRSLDELEYAISQAASEVLPIEEQMAQDEPSDPLQPFRDASDALDKAIELLEDESK